MATRSNIFVEKGDQDIFRFVCDMGELFIQTKKFLI